MHKTTREAVQRVYNYRSKLIVPVSQQFICRVLTLPTRLKEKSAEKNLPEAALSSLIGNTRQLTYLGVSRQLLPCLCVS